MDRHRCAPQNEQSVAEAFFFLNARFRDQLKLVPCPCRDPFRSGAGSNSRAIRSAASRCGGGEKREVHAVFWGDFWKMNFCPCAVCVGLFQEGGHGEGPSLPEEELGQDAHREQRGVLRPELYPAQGALQRTPHRERPLDHMHVSPPVLVSSLPCHTIRYPPPRDLRAWLPVRWLKMLTLRGTLSMLKAKRWTQCTEQQRSVCIVIDSDRPPLAHTTTPHFLTSAYL